MKLETKRAVECSSANVQRGTEGVRGMCAELTGENCRTKFRSHRDLLSFAANESSRDGRVPARLLLVAAIALEPGGDRTRPFPRGKELALCSCCTRDPITIRELSAIAVSLTGLAITRTISGTRT